MRKKEEEIVSSRKPFDSMILFLVHVFDELDIAKPLLLLPPCALLMVLAC